MRGGIAINSIFNLTTGRQIFFPKQRITAAPHMLQIHFHILHNSHQPAQTNRASVLDFENNYFHINRPHGDYHFYYYYLSFFLSASLSPPGMISREARYQFSLGASGLFRETIFSNFFYFIFSFVLNLTAVIHGFLPISFSVTLNSIFRIIITIMIFSYFMSFATLKVIA